MALIFDTGPLYASLDRTDAAHPACRRLIADAYEPLIIPSTVLSELDYLVATRMGPGPMIALTRDIIAGAYRIEDLELSDYERIAELMDGYSDSDIGFVDASVIAIAERLMEPKVVTLDHRHFPMVRVRHVDALELLP